MPDPRGLFFVINERQNRWSLYGEEKPLFRSTDAEPLPAESKRERLSYPRRLTNRLHMIVRPGRHAHRAPG